MDYCSLRSDPTDRLRDILKKDCFSEIYTEFSDLVFLNKFSRLGIFSFAAMGLKQEGLQNLKNYYQKKQPSIQIF